MQQGKKGFSKPIVELIDTILDGLDSTLVAHSELVAIRTNLIDLQNANFIRILTAEPFRVQLEAVHVAAHAHRNTIVKTWCTQKKQSHQTYHSAVLKGPAHVPPPELKKLLKKIDQLYAEGMTELTRVYAA